MPRFGSGVVRKDPLPFPGQMSYKATKPGSAVLSLSLRFLSVSAVLLTRPLYVCVICVFCRLVVLIMLSVPVQVIDWKEWSPK